MKPTIRLSLFIFFVSLISHSPLQAQRFSVDLAGIRNMRNDLNGFNVSLFYHFNEKLSAGAELNRFPGHTVTEGTEKVTASAWDFDYNLHYLIPLRKTWKGYLLTGFSHTSEKEALISQFDAVYTVRRFWSYNTGFGMLWETGRVVPHIEYNFTWGQLNQQFLLAGFSFEFGKEKEKKEGRK